MREIDRNLVKIIVYLQNGELYRQLEIPGRGVVDGPARPEDLCDEGEELFSDIERQFRGLPDKSLVFKGSQLDWEEGRINSALASRGQRINWQRT